MPIYPGCTESFYSKAAGAPCVLSVFWLLHRVPEELLSVCAGLPRGCIGRGLDAEAQVGSLLSTLRSSP